MRWNWVDVKFHNSAQKKEKQLNHHCKMSKNHSYNKKNLWIQFKNECKKELTCSYRNIRHQNLKIWFESFVQGELQWAKSSLGSCHNFQGIQVMWWHHLKYSRSWCKHLCWHSHNSLRHHNCSQHCWSHHYRCHLQLQEE